MWSPVQTMSMRAMGSLCENELILEGDGTAKLKVSSGQSEEYSNGIYAWTCITISDCTVEAVGGTPSDGAEVDSFDSAAISCEEDMTLDNCTVIATAGTADSMGIDVYGMVSILGTDNRPFVVKMGADADSAIEVEGSPFAEETNLWDIPEVYDYDCGYMFIAAHTHMYGDWEYDAAQHWKACECGEITGTAAHTASGMITVTPATETTEGLRHKVCTVCGYEMESETIPALVVIRGVDAGGIQLTLTNRTAGTCLAALYDSSGRMLTAGFLNVAANAGDISLSFPAFEGDPATVKFFFLDESFAPIYRCTTRDYASE